ncbi:MAG: hypothetical protein WBA76_19010 [Phormidesmis sp.]
MRKTTKKSAVILAASVSFGTDLTTIAPAITENAMTRSLPTRTKQLA